MSTNTNDPLTFIEDHYETHKVLKKDIQFRAVSMEQLFKLRSAGVEIAKAVAILFTSTKADTGTIHREQAPNPDSVKLIKEQLSDVPISDARHSMFLQMVMSVKPQETIVDPLSVHLATKRGNDQSQAIADLVGTLTSEETLAVICGIIFDSVKQGLWPDPADYPSREDFAEKITGPAMYDFIKGVALVNRGTLGPLVSALGGKGVVAAVTGLMSEMTNRVDQLGQKVSDESNPSENEQTEKTDEAG